MRHKLAVIVVLLAVTGLSVGASYYTWRGEAAPAIVTGVVTRGPIVTEIAATGTVEAVTTVQVGSQVSGTIQELNADFNSIVRKGQVLARLDPSLFQTQVDSPARQPHERRRRISSGRKSTQADAQVKADRAKELADKQLIPVTDLETAQVAARTAEAQVRSAQAQLAQARAALTQAEVNLQKTIITSPIDGIVIARSVDVGQTVAASLQAPTIFSIAADLSEMQVKTSVDESDLGNVRDGQIVSFRVDAYPTRTFSGKVTQIRLDPVVAQNVVTYAAIISAANPALELKPGMTANVTIEVSRKDNVLRVPSAALRFRPTEATLTALGQDVKVLNQARTGRRCSGQTGGWRRLYVRRSAAPDSRDARRERRGQHGSHRRRHPRGPGARDPGRRRGRRQAGGRHVQPADAAAGAAAQVLSSHDFSRL